jgi:hypothetical protein
MIKYNAVKMKKIPYPEGLRLKMLKITKKFLSIAMAIKCKFFDYFYPFLAISKF